MDVFLKSFPGFALGSEFFILKNAIRHSVCCMVMLAFRFTQVILGISLVSALYAGGKVEKISNILFWKFIDLSDLRDELDYDFAAKNLPEIFIINTLFITNIMLIQFMPWKKSPFFVSSKGFPTLATLKFCYGVNIVQSMGSVICRLSISYMSLMIMIGPQNRKMTRL